MGDFDNDDPTRVDDVVEIVDLVSGEITRPHDGREWLKGFQGGVIAGRKDVLDALRRVFGVGAISDDIVSKVLKEMVSGP